MYQQEFASNPAMLSALKQVVSSKLQEAIQLNGKASLCVAANKALIELFVALSEIDLDWEKVTVFLAHSSYNTPVDIYDKSSLVRRYLLTNYAQHANFINLDSNGQTARSAAFLASIRLCSFPQTFDVTILNVGEGGAVAGLYPNSDKIAEALNLTTVAPVMALYNKSPGSPYLSLSLPRILNSAAIILVFYGEAAYQSYQTLDMQQPLFSPVAEIVKYAYDRVLCFATMDIEFLNNLSINREAEIPAVELVALDA